ncbi:MAG TPA: energy transducer TonB [Desulfotignum sp.]|nr:energy transducer TonB [Desulfotignum sp.]
MAGNVSIPVRSGSGNWFGWVLAGVVAAALNLFLFAVMPEMIRAVPENLERHAPVQAIQVVRVKRPEPPPQKQKPPEPEPPKPQKTAAPKAVQKKMPRPPVPKPSLPFVLNPKLPPVAHSLEMPPLETFSMDTPQLKDRYMAHELETGLIPLAKVAPVYPLHAARRGIEGKVRVQFLVTAEGTVQDIRILAAEPEKLFDQSVIDCVSRWRFQPGRVQGIPVAALAQTTIKFQLE